MNRRLLTVATVTTSFAAFANGFNEQWKQWKWDESGRSGLYAEPSQESGSNKVALEARAATPVLSTAAAFPILEARVGGTGEVDGVDLGIYNTGFLLFLR